MRLLPGLLAFSIAGLLLAGCQAVEQQQRTPSQLQSRVDTSIIEAAETSERRGDFANAASYYRSVYEREPDDVEVAIGLARNLRYIDRAREAEAVLERALRNAPKDARLLAERGKVHLANLEAPEAVEVLSRAAEAGNDGWDVQTALGVGFDRLGLYDQAERHYQNALAQAPDNAVVLNNYGLSLAQRGNLKGAVEALRRAASQFDAGAKTRQNLALMYAMSGDLIRAEELVRRDLPPALADQNMMHYRQLAANRRFADAAAVTRAAAERPGLGGAPAAGIVATPLAAPSSGETAAAPADGSGETVTPVETSKESDQPVAKPADMPKASEQPAVAAAPADAKTAKEPMAKPAETAEAPEKPAEMSKTPEKPADKAVAVAKAPDKPEPLASKPSPGPPTLLTPPPAGEDKKAAADEAAAKPAAATGHEAPYKLQLASFRRAAQAEQARKLLMDQHKEVLGNLALEVSRINLGSRGDFFRVLSDPLDNRAAAADLCRLLKTRNADCLLVRVE